MKRAFLRNFPQCAACGSQTAVTAHHIVPFAVDRSQELLPSNLITLCESGTYGINCHLVIGHCGSWHLINPHVREDAAQYLVNCKLRPV